MANQKRSNGNPGYRIYDDPQRPGRKLVQVALGHGRYIRRRAATTAAAEEIGQELVERLKQKLNVKAGVLTLPAFVNIWWDKAIKPRDLAPKTKADYRQTLERYALPDWGRHRLDEFDAPLIIDMFHELLANYSPDIAHRTLTKLHMVFDAARRWKYMRDNPVADARKDLPARERNEKQALTVVEIRRLWSIVADHRLADMYFFKLTMGTRLGETLGLQWDDFDWQKNTVTICRQVQEVNGTVEVREKTKTKAGRRTLPLPPRLRARVFTRWEQQGESVFVFTNDAGGMLAPSNFARHFRGGRSGHKKRDGSERLIEGIRQKAQPADSVTPHTFRHTVSTCLKELGVSEEIRADILGHGKTSITQAYSHTVLRPMQQALTDLEHLLWEAPLDIEQ